MTHFKAVVTREETCSMPLREVKGKAPAMSRRARKAILQDDGSYVPELVVELRVTHPSLMSRPLGMKKENKVR
ncbi:hypothetical protein Syun_020641 [Stephania yunnanensis]|uniref:Uncharacterized protein n=1 Tax=Stephania yunnanensis TaxID=152371 RepID=A0AAP0NPV5_9MAGN